MAMEGKKRLQVWIFPDTDIALRDRALTDARTISATVERLLHTGLLDSTPTPGVAPAASQEALDRMRDALRRAEARELDALVKLDDAKVKLLAYSVRSGGKA